LFLRNRVLLGVVASLVALGCSGSEPGPKGTTEDEDCRKHRYYADADHDGLGDPERSKRACEQPDGYVDNADDDDDDCAGQRVFYEDADGDGLGDPTSPVVACSAPEGSVSNHDDAEP